MKHIFSLPAAIISSMIFGQNISDFKSIYINEVPAKGDKYITAYEIPKLFAKKLHEKGYDILRQNPAGSCDAAFAEVHDASNMLKNKVRVEIKDCNGKILYSAEGKSDEKDYETGFPDALANAAKNIPAANPNTKPADIQILSEEKPVSQTVTARSYAADEEKSVKNKEYAAQSPRNISVENPGNQNFHKVNLSASQFILVKGNSSVPFATFRESGRSGIYHVALEGGAHGLGYIEGGKIIVEVPKGEGFKRMELSAD